MFRRILISTHKNFHAAFQVQKLYSSNVTATTTNIPIKITTSTRNDSVLHEQSLEPSHIQEAIKIQPTLNNIPLEVWQRSHATFINHGLETIGFLQIITRNPAILLRPSSKIIQAFEYWRSCQFGEKLLHLLLIKYPELFDVSDGQRLLKRIAFLKSYFGTNKNVWKILMNSPDLLEQTEHNIIKKIDYIQQQMRIEVPEIVKSEALSKPFEEIRCRHVFLVRLGNFIPRALKSNPNEPTKNNRLYQITDTSHKTFATKICHVTLPEYEAFQELYEKELVKKRKKAEEEDDDLSDED